MHGIVNYRARSVKARLHSVADMVQYGQRKQQSDRADRCPIGTIQCCKHRSVLRPRGDQAITNPAIEFP